MIAFNAWVDPFQHYRKAERFPARFYNAWQRYENPGLAKHYDYDRIVTGSSLMECVIPEDVDRVLGGQDDQPLGVGADRLRRRASSWARRCAPASRSTSS